MVDPHIEDVGRSLPTRDPGTCSVGEQVLAATGPCTAGYDSGFPPDDLPVDQAATSHVTSMVVTVRETALSPEGEAADTIPIVCVQETKLSVIDDFIVMQILGTGFDYVSLLADGTRGGVLVAWRSSLWSGCSFSVRRFSISVRLAPVTGGDEWWLTSVYGPATDLLKPVFLAELHDLRQVRTGP
jgi:hypothetical protein